LESPKNPLTDADIQTMIQEAVFDSEGQVNYESLIECL
jgi:Ca2+-binding EF-hand superfamily protein